MCPLGSCSKLLITSTKGNDYFSALPIIKGCHHKCSLYCIIFYSVSHAHAWKFLKPHMFAIIQDVLFPIMSHSPADQELWETDPYEYIRVKFGMIMCITQDSFIFLTYIFMYLVLGCIYVYVLCCRHI